MNSYEKIPAEIKQLKQWVCWRGIPDDNRPGKLRKIPINARTGGQAQSNNSDTWCGFDEAVQAADGYDGIGFMFANGYFGVDIDNIPDELEDYYHGAMDNIVAEFVHTLQSYSELSISGNGMHIICKGELPTGGRRRKNVEMYQSGRYFIMTGNSFSEYTEINQCTDAIKFLHEKYIGGGVIPTVSPDSTSPVINLSDNEVLELAGKSKRGGFFNDLYDGRWDMYFPSQSEADMSFCSMLAFWCRKDATQMDRLFRSSGLMREKWDRRQSGSTYGKKTIEKAINGCNAVYEPPTEYSISIGTDKKKDEPAKKYTFDDIGNAQRFIDHFGDSVRYSYVHKQWMRYDGRKWSIDNTGVVRKMAEQTIEKMSNDIDTYTADHPDPEEIEKAFNKHVKISRSNKSQTALLKQSEHHVPILPNEIDREMFMFNAYNGIIDLKRGELLPHDRNKYMTKMSPVEFTDKADHPVWDRFLNDIFDGNTELIRYIQKTLGYTLTGSIDDQCMYFLHGDGSNGKSTFLGVVTDILGDYACTTQAETLMVKHVNNGNASSNIARLQSARLVVSAEPNQGFRLDEGLVKQLTGGELVTARYLYGNDFEYRPEYKIWVGSNHKPIIRGTDEGIWRRVRLIPFEVTIPEERRDKKLKYKLRQEYPAILAWMVEGCLMWFKEGETIPECVRSATRQYRKDMDVVRMFIEECCIVGSGEVQASQAFKAYRQWARDNGEYDGMSNTMFGREMSKQFEKYHVSAGWFYRGIHLRPSYEPYFVNFNSR